MQLRFTKHEVDYLVGDEKFVKEILPVQKIGNYYVILLPIYRKGEAQPIKALAIEARVAVSIPGLPAAIPSVALNWHGHRIRGIDRETRHDNPDGSPCVYGWHEHIWSEKYKDDCVRAFPEPKHKDLRGILREGLRRWNVKVFREQMEVEP